MTSAGASSASSSTTTALRLSGYVVLCELGPGPNGRCCKVREKPHRDVPPYMDDLEPCYALKCIDLAEPNLTTDGRQRAVQGMQGVLNLQHTNVVRYHRAFLYEGRLCYMTEFADCGTLHHMIYKVKERGQRLPEPLVWHLLTQICHGLKALHDAGLVHRALKTRNVSAAARCHAAVSALQAAAPSAGRAGRELHPTALVLAQVLLFEEQLFSHPQFKYRCKLSDVGIPELLRHVRPRP